jgi:hypothetical protein
METGNYSCLSKQERHRKSAKREESCGDVSTDFRKSIIVGVLDEIQKR